VLGAPSAGADAVDLALARVEAGDTGGALPELERLARAGDPRAQDALAGILARGIGVRADVSGAMGWYCLLANHPEGGRPVMHAVWFLAEYFRTGGALPGSAGYRGGSREREDPIRAYFWFRVLERQAELYANVDGPSRRMGQVGAASVGRELYAQERAALDAAVARWRPRARFDAPAECLELPGDAP
jgi:hypothetical protein